MSRAPMFTPISRVGVATRQLVRPCRDLKSFSILIADLAGNLGRVFLGADHHERAAHQPDIVVLLLRAARSWSCRGSCGGCRRRSGRVGWSTRWQVVQRSRTWLVSTTSFSRFTCHTSAQEFLLLRAQRDFREQPCVSSVRNSQSIVAAASTSSVSGGQPTSSRGPGLPRPPVRASTPRAYCR